jgi:hypothetical protein
MEFCLYDVRPEHPISRIYGVMVLLFLMSISLSYAWTHEVEMIKHHDVASILVVSLTAYVVLKLSVTSPHLIKKII